MVLGLHEICYLAGNTLTHNLHLYILEWHENSVPQFGYKIWFKFSKQISKFGLIPQNALDTKCTGSCD